MQEKFTKLLPWRKQFANNAGTNAARNNLKKGNPSRGGWKVALEFTERHPFPQLEKRKPSPMVFIGNGAIKLR